MEGERVEVVVVVQYAPQPRRVEADLELFFEGDVEKERKEKRESNVV